MLKSHPYGASYLATKKSQRAIQSQQKLRIIGGKWRSRTIPFPSAQGLRPTGDRIRETVFNWLTPTIEGARCLDLFAGSGALSFEALSRGAAHCTALEMQDIAISQLRDSATVLGALDISILQTNSLHYLENNVTQQRYDLVFVDPPFDTPLLSSACALLERGQWLAANAKIYCELSAADNSFVPPPNWQLLRDKISGGVRYCLFSYVEPST